MGLAGTRPSFWPNPTGRLSPVSALDSCLGQPSQETPVLLKSDPNAVVNVGDVGDVVDGVEGGVGDAVAVDDVVEVKMQC